MPTEIASGAADVRVFLDESSALDIGAFLVDGVDLSPGEAVPSDGDQRIDHALRGFLFTCGPDHIRHPEAVQEGETPLFPLHGSLCGTPVRSTAATTNRCDAEIDIALADSGTARLDRRWAIDEETGEIALLDRMTNTGKTGFPAMMMYHLNIGGRLLDAATRIVSRTVAGGDMGWRFGEGESAHFCLPAVANDGWAEVCLGPLPTLKGKSLIVRFSSTTLPYLQMWRCQRGGADVISIEPVSHRIAKRPLLAAAGEMPLLEPDASIDYALSFRVGGLLYD